MSQQRTVIKIPLNKLYFNFMWSLHRNLENTGQNFVRVIGNKENRLNYELSLIHLSYDRFNNISGNVASNSTEMRLN